MLCTAARWLAVAAMAAYGLILGVLCGHLWLALFVVPSPMDFMERRNLWPIEAPTYTISALFGASILTWFAVGAMNGHFGFNAPWLAAKRVRHSLALGATYGACAGALLSTLLTQSFGLVLVREPTTATALWATSPHWAILVEVIFGGVMGGTIGAAIGVALPRVATGSTDETTVHAAAGPSGTRRVMIVIAAGVLGYAIAAGVTQGSESRIRNAVMIVSSSALVYFSGATAFVRQLLQAYGAGARKPLMRWAVAAGLACGSAVGLRLALYAIAVGWDDRAQNAWLLIACSGLIGSGVGVMIANVSAPRNLN
jgi:hypothetical protein